MNIAIDVTPRYSEHSLRGVGSYTRLLIEALQKYENQHSYYLFTRGEKVSKKADLVHYPYFDPFFLTLPLVKPKPVVVTVHDLTPMAYPTHFPRGIRGEMKWQIQRFSLNGAHRIITDSRASKADIHRLANIDERKIHVVYLAPGGQFKPIMNKPQLEAVSSKYRLPNKFILYVGDVNWNKNITGLIKAFAWLRTKNQELGINKIKLVFVGKAFLDETLPETQKIDTTARRLGVAEEVVRTGYVAEEDLSAIYTLAAVYVQPSFAEGFGLPVLEAMACGCPVVVSDRSSLTEIAGPAIRVDPQSPVAIAEGIEAAGRLNRQRWQSEATDWIKRFSWKRVASQTAAVYKRALGQ